MDVPGNGEGRLITVRVTRRAALGILAATTLSACQAPLAPTAAPTPPAPSAASTVAPTAAATASTAPPAPTAAPTAPAKPVQAPSGDTAVADFYRGKTVKLIVGFTPGGGFDIYSRAIAKYLGRYIPGNPTVVVENMAGASSMVALNHTVNVAPKDGTVVVNFIGTLAQQQLLKAQGVEFDMTKLHYLGAPSQTVYVLVVRADAGVTKLDQVLGASGKTLVIGANAPGSTVTDGPVILNNLIGTNFKVVTGYPGTAEIRLALDKGEVDGWFNGWDSTILTNAEEIRTKRWLPLVQLTTDKLSDPQLAGVPGIDDLAKDDQQRLLMRYALDLPNRFTRAYAVTAEIPADRVAALQSAFMKVVADREFLADAERSKLDVNPLTGDQVKKLVSEYLTMPAQTRDDIKRYTT